MQPIREIVIREWLPGSYTVMEDGRETSCSSRSQLWSCLRGEFGKISDPDDLNEIEELKQEMDMMKEEVASD